MRMELIGKKHFGGVVDITDPCYDRDVWCRTTATVKDGMYDCCTWEQSYECTWVEYTLVAAIGIYLDGIIPQSEEMEQIASIGVDAGLAGFFINKPDYTAEQWNAFCDSLGKGDAWIKDEGFFSHTGHGDGCYGVYAKKTNGVITALEIRFGSEPEGTDKLDDK